MFKPTVLIVDDEKPTREGLRAALEDRYDVYIAEDGESAIRLLEEDPFDVLLTDLRMPGVHRWLTPIPCPVCPHSSP